MGRPMSATGHHPDQPDGSESELAPDEPHTPLWLTLLGGALALLAVIYFVVTRPPGKTTDELRHAAGPVASASASAAPAPPGPPTPMPPAHE